MEAYSYLGPAILTLAVFLGCAWLLLKGRTRTWYSQQVLVCPADGMEASVGLLTRLDSFELLVTAMPEAKTTVCTCSRFPDGQVTCDQRCLKRS